MANEIRLIDANALQFEPDPWGGMNSVIFLGRSGGKTMAMVQSALKRMIDNAPTVDAVPVVRCRDCKHYDKDTLWCNINSAQFTESHYNWYADDFCSYGAKMDGDGNA